jgi:hypothetical protein
MCSGLRCPTRKWAVCSRCFSNKLWIHDFLSSQSGNNLCIQADHSQGLLPHPTLLLFSVHMLLFSPLFYLWGAGFCLWSDWVLVHHGATKCSCYCMWICDGDSHRQCLWRAHLQPPPEFLSNHKFTGNESTGLRSMPTSLRAPPRITDPFDGTVNFIVGI